MAIVIWVRLEEKGRDGNFKKDLSRDEIGRRTINDILTLNLYKD
jgi:hypothetical protein